MTKIFYPFLLSFLFFVACKESKQKIENKMYSGVDISDKVSIERNKNTKEAILTITIGEDWSLYAGTSVDSIDCSKPILEGNKAGSYNLLVNDTVRSYFKLKTDASTFVFAERHLPMAGGYNFRDLGGIKTDEGKFIKWGKIFRSDDLHKLTESDLRYLSSIPIHTLVDFRSADEIVSAPDLVPSSVIKDIQLSITPGNLMTALDINSVDQEQANDLMKQLNILLVSDSLSINQYLKFFTLLQNENDLPLIFHCSAGKDRTGMATALLLFGLGVDEEIIYNDYLASNFYLSDKYSQYITQRPDLKPLFEVRKEFLQAGIDYIIKEYGSVDNYLINVLQVDLQKLRDIYLY